MSWGNYLLFTREAVPTDEVPVAVAGTAMEALGSFAPAMRVVASAHGHVKLFVGDKPDLARVEFPPQSDWAVVGIDAEGRHHVAIPTHLRRPSTQARTWERLPEVAKRVVAKRWAQLDQVVMGGNEGVAIEA